MFKAGSGFDRTRRAVSGDVDDDPLMLTPDEEEDVGRLIAVAFEEDLGGQADVTTESLVPADARGEVRIVSRATGVLAGAQVSQMILTRYGSGLEILSDLEDGSPLENGTCLAIVRGPMASLLTAERTVLNFLTLLSGVATLTRRYVDAVADTSAMIYDTRKTLPGLRTLQKFAVRCGGGHNHRFGLYDAVLIKDNHLAWWLASGHSLADAVTASREKAPAGMTIQIEVDSLEQLEQVLPARPDIVLLDNMPPELLAQGVELRNRVAPMVELEASGGISLETVHAIARAGVDRISIGALTHSAPALDIGFDWSK